MLDVHSTTYLCVNVLGYTALRIVNLPSLSDAHIECFAVRVWTEVSIVMVSLNVWGAWHRRGVLGRFADLALLLPPRPAKLHANYSEACYIPQAMGASATKVEQP